MSPMTVLRSETTASHFLEEQAIDEVGGLAPAGLTGVDTNVCCLGSAEPGVGRIGKGPRRSRVHRLSLLSPGSLGSPQEK